METKVQSNCFSKREVFSPFCKTLVFCPLIHFWEGEVVPIGKIYTFVGGGYQ
jgi:hypothetical protein